MTLSRATVKSRPGQRPSDSTVFANPASQARQEDKGLVQCLSIEAGGKGDWRHQFTPIKCSLVPGMVGKAQYNYHGNMHHDCGNEPKRAKLSSGAIL